jgi:carbon storage regulator
MLVITVKEKEKLLVGDEVKITVLEIRGKQIRLGIEAPLDVVILREKLVQSKDNDPKKIQTDI